MTIPRLQGWFDESADSFRSLADTFSKALFPNRDFQVEMRKYLAQNPHLIQSFADLSARDPQLMKKMGFGPVADMVSGISESSTSVKDRQTKGYLETPKTPTEEAQIRANTLGVRDPLEQREKEANVVTQESNSILQKALARYSDVLARAQGEKAGTEIRDAEKYFTDAAIGVKAREKLGNNYANKDKLTPEEYDILSSHPDFKAGFDRLRDDYWQKVTNQIRIDLSAKDRSANIEAQMMATYARQIAEYGTVDPRAVLTFTQLPVDQQEELINTASSPTDPQAAQLWRAGQAMKLMRDKREISVRKPMIDILYGAVRGPLSDLNKKTSNKNLVMDALNLQLRIASEQLGITNPPVFKLTGTAFGGLFQKKRLILESGDLEMARELGKLTNIEVVTPKQDIKESSLEAISNDPQTVENLAKALAVDLKSGVTTIEQFEEKLAGNIDLIKKVRQALPKYQR